MMRVDICMDMDNAVCADDVLLARMLCAADVDGVERRGLESSSQQK